jgi:hypothetical protein
VIHSGAGGPSAGPSTDAPTSSRKQSPFHILQQSSEADEDPMEFVVQQGAEEDDGTCVQETP